MYVSAVFVVRCLYSTMSLTLVREQCFIRIIYYYYYYLGGRSLHSCAWDQPGQPERHDHFSHLRSHHWRVSPVLLPHLGDGLTVCVHQRPLWLARSCHLEPGWGPRPWLEEGPGYSQVSRQLSGKCMLMLLVVLVVYHWQELLQVIFVTTKVLSWQAYFCWEQNVFVMTKHVFVATKHVFVMTKTCFSWPFKKITFALTNTHLLRQNMSFVMTKLLSWQIFVMTKLLSQPKQMVTPNNFVCAKVLSRQVYFCHSKYIFVRTNMCLLLQNFCHNKNDTCCSSHQRRWWWLQSSWLL